MHRSRNQRKEVQVLLPTITSTNPHGKSVPPIPAALGSTELEILVPKEKNISTKRRSNSPFEL